MTDQEKTSARMNKVLIANDSLQGMDIALGKAAKIEHYTGAELLLAEVIYDTIAEEPVEVLPRDQQAILIEGLKAAERNGLEQLIAPYREKVASVDHQVLWNKNATDGIIDHLNDFDLLIKPISQHTQLIDRLHAPLDWSLMRAATCPVLISKNDWENTSVMAAVSNSY